MYGWKTGGATASIVTVLLTMGMPVVRAGTVLKTATGPGGHLYEVVTDTSVSWSQAQAAADQAGGFLATIGDAQEQAFVEGLLSDADAPTGSYWFGLHQIQTTGEYRPLSGAATNYDHFLAGQPDNNGGNETSGSILWSTAADGGTNGAAARRGFWNDLPDVNPTVNSIYPDLNRGGYLVEFKGTGPAFNNGDGDNLLGHPNSVPLPAAAGLFPAGAAVAALAMRRLRMA